MILVFRFQFFSFVRFGHFEDDGGRFFSFGSFNFSFFFSFVRLAEADNMEVGSMVDKAVLLGFEELEDERRE